MVRFIATRRTMVWPSSKVFESFQWEGGWMADVFQHASAAVVAGTVRNWNVLEQARGKGRKTIDGLRGRGRPTATTAQGET